MGIKNLGKFIRENASNSITKIKANDLNGSIIAIDTSLIMHQILIAMQSEDDLKNKDGIITSHLYGIVTKALVYLKKNITPIFVFDGLAPILKKEVLDKRKDIKNKAINKLKDDTIIKDDKIKLLKKTVEFGYKKAKECMEILKLMGLPVIEAPGEADAQCAALMKEGVVDYVLSEDMDLLTFGAKKLLRGSIAKDDLSVYNLDLLLNEIDLTQKEFIDFCILSGCDYLAETISKVKVNRAYKLIKEHKSIEMILTKDKNILNGNYKVPESFDYKAAREYFNNPPVISFKGTEFKVKLPNDKELINKLKEYDFSHSTITKVIDVIYKGKKKLFLEDN